MIAAFSLMFRACPGGSGRPTWRGLLEQLRYSVPLGVAGVVGATCSSLDQVMVSARCKPETFAIYSVGAFELPLIGIVTGSITSVILVDYVRLYREGRTTQILDLAHRIMIKSASILLPLMILCLCVAPDLTVALFGKQYEASARVFRVYLLFLPIRTLSFGALLQATGNSRHILYQASMELAINACLGWFAIGVLGAIGAAIAAVVVGYLQAVPYWVIVLRKTLRCRVSELFPWMQLLRMLAVSTVGAIPILLMTHLTRSWPVSLRLVMNTATYGATTLALFSALGWLHSLVPLDRICQLVVFKQKRQV